MKHCMFRDVKEKKKLGTLHGVCFFGAALRELTTLVGT